MDALTKLSALLDRSLSAVTREDYKNIRVALASGMPEVVTTLTGIMTATESTPGQRLTATKLLLSIWERALGANLREEKISATKVKHRAKIATAQAVKARAKADEQVALVHIDKERKKIQRVLNRHAGETK